MTQEELEDDDYGTKLRAARIKDELAQRKSSLESEEIKEEAAAPPGNHTVIFVLAFLVAGISDIADIFVIGAIPIVGDLLDAGTGIILAALFLPIGGRQRIKRLVPVAGAMIFEFLPFGVTDIVPTYTVEVIFTWYMVQKENQEANR